MTFYPGSEKIWDQPNYGELIHHKRQENHTGYIISDFEFVFVFKIYGESEMLLKMSTT